MSEKLPKGLKNIANSCYLNSVIQNIACIPWLLRRLEGHGESTTTAMGALIAVVKRLNSSNESNPSTCPQLVRNAMRSYHPEIADSSYQDADDILQKIMNKCFEEEMRRRPEKRVFTTHFQIKQRFAKICLSCDTISSIKTNETATIPLMAWDSSGNQLTELRQTLASHIIPEVIKEARCYGKCAQIARQQGRSLTDGGITTAKGIESWQIIEYAPRMLVLNISGAAMSGHTVNFPKEIDLAPYIYPARFLSKVTGNNLGPIHFKLSGTFRHHGSFPHYTATVRLDSDGHQWAHCDDSKIYKKDWRYARSENVTSMFYECRDWIYLERIYKFFDEIKSKSKFWNGTVY